MARPVTPAQQVARFIATVPDGALIATDPQTGDLVYAAIICAGRRMLVDVFPSRDAGVIRAQWDGPADGERHEETWWVTGDVPDPDSRERWRRLVRRLRRRR